MELHVPFPRASLFLASRLASVVQKFRHRLQEKVQQKKKGPNPFGASYHRGIRLKALSDLERCTTPRLLTVSHEPRSAVSHPDHGKWINGLLRDLNNHSNRPTLSLTRVAADEQLFLTHAHDNLIETLTQHATLPQAAFMFDSSTFLIGKLEALQLGKSGKWTEADAGCEGLKEALYIANLLHLLRELQQILFLVLVHRSITWLDEFALRWQTYWQQEKSLSEDWFTEWPSGKRPLSTTWPWPIRPALVVLWGVCWMFYTQGQRNVDKPRPPVAQQLVEGSANWILPSNFPLEGLEQARGLGIDTSSLAWSPNTRMQAQAQAEAPAQARSPSSPMMVQAANVVPSLDATSFRSVSAGAQPQSYSPIGSNRGRQLYRGISHGNLEEPQNGTGPTSVFPGTLYTQPGLYTSPLESRDLEWVISVCGDIQATHASVEQVPSNVWSRNIQPDPPSTGLSRADVPTFQVSPVEDPSYASASGSAVSQSLNLPHLQLPFGRNQDMGGFEDYPSPHSERGRQASVTTPTSMPESGIADHATTPSSDGNRGSRISVRRGDPPRNDQEQIYCAHHECAQAPPIFRRPCEWNKHMDKHDRPYKCIEPGCDKVQGFTYSGGLLRHQREVHKKNKSTGKELYCHYPNCNRSKSQSFTRKENLAEHIRRRHVAEGVMVSPGFQSDTATPAPPARPGPERARKRKRTASTGLFDELQPRNDDSDEGEDSQPVKRLKDTIALRDKRIDELEAELMAIKEQISELRSKVGT